jgi:putative MFS transporter
MDEIRKKQFLIFSVCGLGLFIDGYDLYVAALAEPFIRASFNPSPVLLGLIQSSALLGAVLGAIIMGRVADLMGRKSMLLLNLIFFVIVALLSACALDPYSLCFFRFLIGLGVGADYPIVAAYLSEMTLKRNRATSMALVMFINCVASPVVALTAWAIFHFYPSLDAWRLFFALGALPAIVGLFLRAKLPESMAWRALKKCANRPKQYRRLFTPPLSKKTFILCSTWFLMNISNYGIGLFTPSILGALNLHQNANILDNVQYMIKSTLFINSFIMLGAFFSIFVINRTKIVTLQKNCFVFSAIGLLIMSQSDSHDLSLVLTGFIIFNFFINLGPGLTTYYLPTLTYPPEIRASGHGLASGIAKSGAFLGTFTLPLMQSYFGIQSTLGILAFTLILAYFLTKRLGDETATYQDKGENGEILISAGAN